MSPASGISHLGAHRVFALPDLCAFSHWQPEEALPSVTAALKRGFIVFPATHGADFPNFCIEFMHMREGFTGKFIPCFCVLRGWRWQGGQDGATNEDHDRMRA